MNMKLIVVLWSSIIGLVIATAWLWVRVTFTTRLDSGMQL